MAFESCNSFTNQCFACYIANINLPDSLLHYTSGVDLDLFDHCSSILYFRRKQRKARKCKTVNDQHTALLGSDK